MKDMMAFWAYDRYPHFLCGVITRMDDRGMVETMGFGAGNWFKPVIILPIEAGQQLERYLKSLEQKNRNAEKLLRKESMIALNEVIGKFGLNKA